jgi:large subunit ribosomal protein L4
MRVDVYNMAGEVVDAVELLDEVFGVEPNEGLVHQAVVQYLANQRQGTVDTKTRGEVSGGGKKPYKQKGTGRARQGSTRAPHWRHGGVVFGPHPRDYRQDMPTKMRRQALRSALSAQVAEGRIRVVDQLQFAEPKTRLAAEFLGSLDLDGSALVVTPEVDQLVYRTVRNIPKTTVLPAAQLNAYEVVKHRYLVMPVDAARRIEGWLRRGPAAATVESAAATVEVAEQAPAEGEGE